MNKQVLKDMIAIPSPSGNEYKMGKHIMNYMKNEGIDVSFDSLGSLIHTINKDEKFKIMMVAHMDEISLMIVGKNSDGTLRVLKNGGVNCNLYINQRVRVVMDDYSFGYGVVNSSKKDVKDTDICIDMGCKDEKFLDSLIGKYAIVCTEYQDMTDGYFTGRALDDRLGVYVINQVLLKLKNEKLNKQVISVNSVGEELTSRGANVSTNMINPNMAIIVDVTYAEDCDQHATNCNVALRKGGVICYSQTVNPKLNKIMIETCEKHNIPFQKEAFPGRTYTDGDHIYTKGFGIPMILVSIPLRYMHSPSEVCHEEDVDNIINMIAEFIKDFDINTNLLPY